MTAGTRTGANGGGGGGSGRAINNRRVRELVEHDVLCAFDFGAAERTQMVRAFAALEPLRQARRTQQVAARLDLHVLHSAPEEIQYTMQYCMCSKLYSYESIAKQMNKKS